MAGNTHLITGYAGTEHIKSADDGSFNAAFFGNGQYVMESGSQFEGSIIDNNTVRIFDGDLLTYGRHIRIEPNAYEELTIETGTAGVNRNDLICMTYTKDNTSGIEDAYMEVIKGTEKSGTASDPKYTNGNILNGATLNQMPLYRVKIEGVVLVELVPLFKLIPTYKTLAEKYEQEFKDACNSHLESLNILDTMEEVTANTQANQLAGALAVKEGFADAKKQLEGKQATITGGATTIASNNLTGNRALVSNTNGKVSVSSVTTAELYQLAGLDTSKNVQTQLNEKALLSVVGEQSALPLSKSTFAYNIRKNAEDIMQNAQAIEKTADDAEANLKNAQENLMEIIEDVGAKVLENDNELDTYLLGCTINTPTISSSGYVSTTDTASFVRYYKVGVMTLVQVSLLVTKEIPAGTAINLVTGLPASNIATPGYLHDLHGASYSVQIDTNGVNLHTYASHQEPIAVNTRLMGDFWYRRKTL